MDSLPGATRDGAVERARPFASYSRADHARVAVAIQAWRLLEVAYDATVPEWRLRRLDAPEEAVLCLAESAQAAARRLLIASVVAARENGVSWARIGGELGISAGSARCRFSKHVGDFQAHFEAVIAPMRVGRHFEGVRDATVYRFGHCVIENTGWWAPRLDEWLGTLGGVPGGLGPPIPAGALGASLSAPGRYPPPENAATEEPPPVRDRHGRRRFL